MNRLLFVLLLSLALTACVVRLPPQSTARPPAPIEASLDRTWEAVTAEFASLGIKPTTTDRGSGRLTGEERFAGPTKEIVANCGHVSGLPSIYPSVGSYFVVVTGDSTRAALTVTVNWQNDRSTKYPVACTSTGRWEATFEAHVRERVARQ